MKRLFLLAVAAAALVSCNFVVRVGAVVGNGVKAQTVLDLEEFSSLVLRGSYKVIYTQTPGAQSVTLTCDENLIEYCDIRVEDGTLIAGTKRGVNIVHKTRPVLTVNSPVLCGVRISGSGSCKIDGPVVAEDDFRMSVSGSGSIRVNGEMECKAFAARISGSGSVGIEELTARSGEFHISGSGSVAVDSLTADTVKARTSGSGSIRLDCKDAGDIDASTSGSGSVIISGNARSIDSRTSGSGRVNYKGLNLPER